MRLHIMEKLLKLLQKMIESKEFKRYRPMLKDIAGGVHIIIYDMKMGNGDE